MTTRSWETLPLKEYQWLENRYFYLTIALAQELVPSQSFKKAAMSNLQDSVFVEYTSSGLLAAYYVKLGDFDKALYYYALAAEKIPVGQNALIDNLTVINSKYPDIRPKLKIFMRESILPLIRSERKESKTFYQKSEALLRALGDEPAAKEVFNRGLEVYPTEGGKS